LLNFSSCSLLASITILASLASSAYAQSAPPASCQLQELMSLPTEYTGDNLHPTIEAQVNGKRVRAQLVTDGAETGFNGGAIDSIDSNIKNDGGGPRVNLDYKIGPHKGKASFPVFNTQQEIPLAVGTDYLLRADLELFVKEKVIKFFSPVGCKEAHLAYWDANSLSIPFTVASKYDRRPRFSVKINGKPVTAMLATQFPYTTLNLRTAKELGITPGSKGVEKAGRMVVGEAESQIWTAVLDTFEIGEEKVSNSKLQLADVDDEDAQLKLGVDFLRSHRILVSMSQKRIFFSYVGGGVFSNNRADGQPWYLTEAENGNADAQFRMAATRSGNEEQDKIASAAWLRKAAAAGNVKAIILVAEETFTQGKFDDSAKAFRQLFALQTPTLNQSIRLYVAAARSGSRQAAMEELQALRPRIKTDFWGSYLLDYHLDKISQRLLFKEAVDVKGLAEERMCEANFQAGQNELIAGRKEAARPFLEAARDQCPKSESRKRVLAIADLTRLNPAPAGQ